MREFLIVLLIVMGFALGAPLVEAQECGDADGNGSVTVTDGVQTLRAAADLPSTCSVAVCDVDGSGTITVTDGVNVLRKAAGLAITESCGGTDTQVETVLREIQPLLTIGIGFATSKPVTSCANAPLGELEESFDPEEGTTTDFTFCQVGNIELDGGITLGTALLTFSFLETSTAVAEDPIAQYEGELTLRVVGAGRSLNGPVDVFSESVGTVTVTFADAIVVAGSLTGGAATLDLSESDIADSVATIRLTFDNSGIAQVLATFADATTATFRFDLAQGVLLR